MFCPLSTDWGNVADWVSGIGALLAVIVALGISTIDHMRRKRERREEFERSQAVRQSYEEYLTELYGRINEAAKKYINDGRKENLNRELGALIGEVKRAEQMPDIEIDTYIAYQKFFRLCVDFQHSVAFEEIGQNVAKICENLILECRDFTSVAN